MAETDTQHMSIALYRYMCQEIVGSEEQVKTIRLMQNISDYLKSSNKIITITSGSYGEGIELRGSDLDIMHVSTIIEVCEDVKIHIIAETTYFTMESKDTAPGFTKLRLLHSNDQSILEDCDKFGHDYYFSNALVKRRNTTNSFSIIHGPCVSDKEGIFDFAFCLRSKAWIAQANQWITRTNSGWPDYDVKQSITKHGVLFVPVGAKGSENEELEWRMSFSIAEKLLIFTFTHTQLLCYALLKFFLKDVLNIDPNCKELICSYYIKTVIFWVSEEVSTSIWKPENLISCFMRCFRRLIYFVEYSVCPHYFIPENNLFENKVQGQARDTLLNQLYLLNSYGWHYILFSNHIAKFLDLSYEIRKKTTLFHVFGFHKLTSPSMDVGGDVPQNLLLRRVISKVLSVKSSKIKYLYTYYLSKLGGQELLPFVDISDNKSSYKHYNTNISTLLLSTRHDAVSGWLFLASFFYKTKAYKKAVDVLNYCFLLCTPEKLYRGIHLSHVHEELFNLPLFRKMTTVQLLKFLFLESVKFYSKMLVPDELQIKEEVTAVMICPFLYVDILSFLCNYNLHHTKQYQDSLKDLQLAIEKNYTQTSHKMLHITTILFNE